MPSFILTIFIFLFGLIIGSFLNCLIYRLSLPDFSFRRSLRGRSFCPHCRHSLSWFDLIPLASFFALRGKCRYCRKRISWQYPVVEILTGFLFVLIFQNYFSGGPSFFVIYYWIIASCLLVIFFYDLKHQLIPDTIVFFAISLAFLYLVFNTWNFGNWDYQPVLSAGLGIIPSFFFLAINLISRGKWMGLGDFKLVLLMGLILGWPGILFALILAFYSGAVVGLAAVIVKVKKMESEIPFAPFLVGGTFVVMLWENQLAYWCEKLFLLE